MWYKLLKASEDPWWRHGYLAQGHSWTSADPDPHDDRNAKLPPPNPNDAIWIFNNGQIESETAGEWYKKGNRGYSFVHDEIFGAEFGGRPNAIKGRYDAKNRIISVVKSPALDRAQSLVHRLLYNKFPGGRIVEL